MYQDDHGNVRKGESIFGPLTAAIPGVPASIVYLGAEHYGKLPLKVSLKPAIRYARKGFRVTERYRTMAGAKSETFLKFPQTTAIYLKDGAVPELDYRLKQKDLARTLELLAEKGKIGFYAGALADKMLLDTMVYGVRRICLIIK